MTGVEVASQATSLPLWMQIVAFVFSVSLAIFQLVQYLNRPTLYVHATRDVFFRLIEAGESLFCSAVLLASRGPILVRDIDVTLTRTRTTSGRSTDNTFPLLITHYGEKVAGQGVAADHKFFGSSPLQYLEASKPYRAIYLCAQRDFQERQKRAVLDFEARIERFRLDNQAATEEETDRLLREFADLIEAQFNLISPLIQIVPGNYRLQMKVTYECVGWRFLGKQRIATSQLSFTVDDALLSKWREDLKLLLNLKGQQIVSQKASDLSYPQFEPTNVVESALL